MILFCRSKVVGNLHCMSAVATKCTYNCDNLHCMSAIETECIQFR